MRNSYLMKEQDELDEGESNPELKVGMRVRVYYDPLTREKLEGIGTVMNIVSGPQREDGYWEYTVDVKFPGEYKSEIFTRRIYLD